MNITRRELTIAGLAAGVLLVLAFVGEHFRDAHRDAELVQLHQRIAVDSASRVLAVTTTDTLRAKADTAAHAVARTDTVWRKVSSAARTRVDTIVASAVPDTVKIRELVTVIDTLRVSGDSLERRSERLVNADSLFRAQVTVERASWGSERKDLAAALKTSESQHRHWGLGATLGYAAVRTNDGTVRAGPGIVAGVVYRW